MIGNDNTSISVSASSYLESGEQVALFGASVSGNTVHFGMDIHNLSQSMDYLDQITEDFIDFKDKVMSEIVDKYNIDLFPDLVFTPVEPVATEEETESAEEETPSEEIPDESEAVDEMTSEDTAEETEEPTEEATVEE